MTEGRDDDTTGITTDTITGVTTGGGIGTVGAMITQHLMITKGKLLFYLR